MPEETKADKETQRAVDLFPVEVGFVSRGANKVPLLVFKSEEAPVTTSSLKGATLAALLVTAYDSLDATAQTAARTKILESLGITSADLDSLMGGTMAAPSGGAPVLAEALGLAEDDVNAAISADAATASGDPAPSEPNATNMNETPAPADASTPPAPPATPSTPATPAAPSEAATPAPSDAPAPTQKADDPTYVFDSAQKKKALMTLDEMVVRLGEIRTKIAALPEGMDGFYSLPLSVAPDVAGISHLAYALEGFNPWEFCVLYKADTTSQPAQGKDKNGQAVQPVRKSDTAQQPSVDLTHALAQAVARGSSPMAAIVRKSVADAVAAELAKFRTELNQDATPKPRPQAVPQIAPSVQVANEPNHSVKPVLKNAKDVTALARQLREEREKSRANR